MKQGLKRSFAVGLAALMLTGLMMNMAALEFAGARDSSITVLSMGESLAQPVSFDEPRNDIDMESARDAGKGSMRVVVATTDIPALARGLAKIPYKGSIGESAEMGLAFPILDVPVGSLEYISSIDGVIGVYEFDGGTTSDGQELKARESPSPTPAYAYDGSGATVAVLDTGIDFSHPALAGKYAQVPQFAMALKENVTGISNVSFQTVSTHHPNVQAGSMKVYINAVETSTSNYTVDLTTGAITFTSALAANTKVNATYNYVSPYYGWPQAFDPMAMKAYADSRGDPAGGGYVNTSYNTTGVFESRHDVDLDGLKDFGALELRAEDMNSIKDQGSPTYSIDELYMARNVSSIFGGFVTTTGAPLTESNMSYAIYFDMGGPATGATFDPRGKLIDTNATHANYVNYVGFNPNGTLIASLSGGKPYATGETSEYLERYLRIWKSDGTLLNTLQGHVSAPYWADWTSDGQKLVSADLGRVYVWDPIQGKLLNSFSYSSVDHPPSKTGEKDLYAMMSVGQDKVAIAGKGASGTGIGIWYLNGTWIADIETTPNNVVVNSVAFSPDGSKLAATLSTGKLLVFDVATLVLEMTVHNTASTSDLLSVEWNPAGNRIATGSKGGNLTVWNYPNPTSYTTETVLVGAAGGEQGPFNLSHVQIQNVTMEIENGGVWRRTLTIDNYTLDSCTGKFALTDAEIIIPGDNLWVNYTYLTLPPVSYWNVDGYWINAIAWSDDSTKIAVGTSFTQKEHNQVKIYDAATPVPANITAFSHDGKATSVSWKGTSIVSGSQDAKLRSFNSASWTYNGIFISHKIDYAFYIDHVGEEWGLNPDGTIWTNNDTIRLADLYKWGGSAWQKVSGVHNDTIGLTPQNSVFYQNNTVLWNGFYYKIGIDNKSIWYQGKPAEINFTNAPIVAYRQWVAGEGYLEFAIPRALLGDPTSMDVLLFSVPSGASRPQDSVPEDPNLESQDIDMTTEKVSISAFMTYTPEILTVNQTAIPSKSVPPKYHIGFHPDKNFEAKGIVGMLLVDANTAGVYDTVIMDGNLDLVFDSKDTVLTKANPAAPQYYYDEYGAMSIFPSGLLYFIADGVNPVPYFEKYSQRYGLVDENFTRDFVPEKGEMICLSGEFTQGAWHGTAAASTILSVAPSARFVPIGEMEGASYFDALFFAAEGYDGNFGSMDDPTLAYVGIHYTATAESGWDVYSKFTDWISTTYTNGTLAFVTGAGDTGYGYSTVAPPASGTSVISVGRCEDYTISTSSAGPNPHKGEVSPKSARGPSFTGLTKPEVLDIGTVISGAPYMREKKNWTEWETSDAAAARTAGALALIGQAYKGSIHGVEKEAVFHATQSTSEPFIVSLAHSPIVTGTCTVYQNGTALPASGYTLHLGNGTLVLNSIIVGAWINASYHFTDELPYVAVQKEILMSGADDRWLDANVQGAGLVNITRSLSLADGTAGISVSPSILVPGEWGNARWDASIAVMKSGESAASNFTASNSFGIEQTMAMSSGRYEKIGEINSGTLVIETSGALWQMMVNETGAYLDDGAGGLARAFAISPYVWYAAQSMKVRATASWNDTYYEEGWGVEHNVGLTVSDLSVPSASMPFPNSALNTLSKSSGSNAMQLNLQSPSHTTKLGAVITLKHNKAESESTISMNWTVVLEFYGFRSWDWLHLSSSSLAVPAGGTAVFNATASVPAGAEPGTNEGTIKLSAGIATQTSDSYSYPNHITDEYIGRSTLPTPVSDEQILSGTVGGETSAQLTHTGIVAGSTDLRTVREWTSWSDTEYVYEVTGSETEDWFYLPQGNITTPVKLQYYDPSAMTLYNLREGTTGGDDFTVDYATGNVSFWPGGYIVADLGAGSLIYAAYNYSLPLTDYSVDLPTGAITFTLYKHVQNETVAIPGDCSFEQARLFLENRNLNNCTVLSHDIAADTWTFLSEGVGYTLNKTWGFLDLTTQLDGSTAIYAEYNATTIAQSDRVYANYSWATALASGALSHLTYVDYGAYGVTLTSNGTTTISPTQYTLTPGTGAITFTPPLSGGENVTADYYWYAPTAGMGQVFSKSNIVPGSLTVYTYQSGGAPTVLPATEYTLFPESGAIVLNAPLTGNKAFYNASYQYYSWQTTIPVTLTVIAELGEMLGDEGIYRAENEKVRMPPITNIVNETLFNTTSTKIINETVAKPTTFTIVDELVYKNAVSSVIGELEFTATGLEGAGYKTYLRTSDAAGYSLLTDSEAIYMNGVPLVKGVDYTISYGSAEPGYHGGEVTFINAPVAGAICTADYCIYRWGIKKVTLDHGAAEYDESLNESSLVVISTNIQQSVISTSSLPDVELDKYILANETITASYSYVVAIKKAYLTYGPAMNPATAIVPASYAFCNNGLPLKENPTSNEKGYIFSPSGEIELRKIGAGDFVTANYSYYPYITSWQLSKGALESDAITDDTISMYRGGVSVSADDYMVDLDTGLVTFPTNPTPDGFYNMTYSYHNPIQTFRAEEILGGPMFGMDSIRLDRNSIVPGTLSIVKNGLALPATDYTLNEQTGIVSLANPLAATDIVTASYNHTDLGEFSFAPDSLARGGDSGDWRLFYINVPAEGMNANTGSLVKFVIDAIWGEPAADIDLRIYMSKAQDNIQTVGGTYPESRFGSFSISQVAKSKAKDFFFTTTNEAEDLLMANLIPGIVIVAANQVHANVTTYEKFQIETGLIYLGTSKVSAYSDTLSGNTEFSIWSSMPWVNGTNCSILGPAIAEKLTNLEVWGEAASDAAEQDAAATMKDYTWSLRLASFLKTVTVEKAATFEARVMGNSADDLDMAIFYDKNADGKIQKDEMIKDGELMGVVSSAKWGMGGYAVCADDDSDEAVKLVLPPDGQYIIAVYGWSVTTGATEGMGAGALFDLEISQIVAGVEGYGLSGPKTDENIGASIYTNNSTVASFERQNFTIKWNFPDSTADSTYGGVLYIGPRNAPGLLGILVNVVVDRHAPDIVIGQPLDLTTIKSPTPVIVGYIQDKVRGEIDASGTRLYVDGEDVTPLASVGVALQAGIGAGYPSGTVSYKPYRPLATGAHRVDLIAKDMSGNVANRTWVFTVDLNAPEIIIDEPDASPFYTSETEIEVNGHTDPTASSFRIFAGAVEIPAALDTDGTFTVTIPLTGTENSIKFTCTDRAGNVGTEMISIIRDDLSPKLSDVSINTGTTTNQPLTTVTGSVNKQGSLLLNGLQTDVNSDRSFSRRVPLQEGFNQIRLDFTDLKGESVTSWKNVTRDTVQPGIAVADVPAKTASGTFSFDGRTEPGATVWVNGKQANVTSDGKFSAAGVALSYGANAVTIVAKDRAGNEAQRTLTLSYEPARGTNWAAIGLMIGLLVIGLVVGILLWKYMGPKPAPEAEVAAVPAEGEAAPVEGEVTPAVEGEAPIEGEAAVEPTPETSAEPVPAEESAPEATPPAAEPAPAEPAPVEPKPETAAEQQLDPAKQERIAKLKKALDDGKISKELYDKNVERVMKQ